MSEVAVAIGSAAPARGHVRTVRSCGFWICTILVSGEMVVGSVWDLLQIEYVRSVFHHLGYPLYLLTIIGVCKLPCGLTLLVPRFPRLKEWAYAGAVINYGGAAASHLFVGDRPSIWIRAFDDRGCHVRFVGVTSGAAPPPARDSEHRSSHRPLDHSGRGSDCVLGFCVLDATGRSGPYLKTVNSQ